MSKFLKYLQLFLTRRADDTRVALVSHPEEVSKADSVEEKWYEDLGSAYI